MQNEMLPGGIEFIAEADGIHEYRLANGMKLLLMENRVAPVVTFLVLYKVGSRNEAVGYTGSTHLLEHMLFKGTPTFNKDKNTQIAATLQKIGAEYNATTWYDRTNYFETVPSDKLELAVHMEADRMRNSFIADADRQSEMTVVRNELERGQNEPMMVLDEAVYATAFREHPYHHPTIGWRADVENVPTARLKEFYDTFYHPNNATAMVIGDFERAHAIELVLKYFGAHAATKDPIPEVYTDEPQQQGERRLVVRRAGELPLVQVAFHTPAALGQTRVLSNSELAERAKNPPAQNDCYPLVVFSVALAGGITSRLYQALVETELAVSVEARADQFRDPGLFSIYATACPGVTPRKVEEVILAELARIAGEGMDAPEVERAKGQIVAQEAYQRDGTYNIASQMSEAEAVADWRFYNDYERNISRVTLDDVRRVACQYFDEDNRTIGHFIPKQAGGGDGNGGDAATNGAKRAHAPKYHHDPEADDLSGGDESQRSDGATVGGEMSRAGTTAREAAGGPTTTQAVEQILTGTHEGKSSDAVSAVTPESAGRLSFASRVVRAELETGAVLLVLENTATPTVSIRGSLRAGSYFEPRDKPGLARITAKMLERGTLKRGKLELARDLEGVGAELDFSADPFAVQVSGRSLAKDFPMLVRVLAEELREPSFPGEELEKLKQQTVAAIREQQSDTRQRAYERFTQLVYDDANPFYTHAGEQLVRSISSITVADVRGFYEKFYGGRSLILTIAGDVRADEAGRLFRQAFETFEGPENVDISIADPAQQEGARREFVLLEDKASVDILLGSSVPLRRDAEDYYAAILANRALGESTLSSRLGLQVRDREGLTYGIASRFRAPSLAAGPWYIAVSVNPSNVERAIDSALGVLREYVEHGVRPGELDDEKSSAIGSFKVSLSTNKGLASALWNAEFHRLGADYIDRFPQLIQAVTIEEVNVAIKKYFRPDHLTVVMAGDAGTGQGEAAPIV
ncbi:MAG: insulinase family protein [Acidobacteria bacterium]|nr:insulinase family protein [Acidobacteriota bacterium]